MNIRALLFLSVFITLTGCKNHYNDMVNWTSEVPIGTDIDRVKELQPDYLKISWDNPDTIPANLTSDSSTVVVHYIIDEIKGDKDILKMLNVLVFINGKYQGREAFH